MGISRPGDEGTQPHWVAHNAANLTKEQVRRECLKNTELRTIRPYLVEDLSATANQKHSSGLIYMERLLKFMLHRILSLV